MKERKRNKLKVVIDTNILISSAIVAEGKPNQVIKAWKEGSFFLMISDPILEEIQDVVKRERFINKYRLFPERIRGLIESLKIGAERIIQISQNLSVSSRDPKDDKLLACALGGNADYLATGDRDLLALNDSPKIGNLKIVSPKEFLELLP